MEEDLNLQESGGFEEACRMNVNKRIERYGEREERSQERGRVKGDKKKYGVRRLSRRQSTSVI